MASDGILDMIKCKACSAFDCKPCIMAPKSDTLFEHDGKRTAKKDMPQFRVRKRVNLMWLEKKRVQFAILFQILWDGRPMVDYEHWLHLYKLFNVPDYPIAY